MAQVSFELTTQQMEELARRFELDLDMIVGEDFRGEAVLAYFGEGAELLDAFVQRCIGTALELEAFQESGGQVLLRDRKGEVRELLIDFSRNGGTLRPPRRLSRSESGARP